MGIPLEHKEVEGNKFYYKTIERYICMRTHTDSGDKLEKKQTTMIRITKETRVQLKRLALENGITLIDQVYLLAFGVRPTRAPQTDGRVHNNQPTDEKVRSIITRMRLRGYTGKAGFFKAASGLGYKNDTQIKYWKYYEENEDMFDLPRYTPPDLSLGSEAWEQLKRRHGDG